MAKTVTFTDIDFTEARIYQTKDLDGTTHLLVGVGFAYIANGLRLPGQYAVELTGTRKTQVLTFFSNLKADILAQEGI